MKLKIAILTVVMLLASPSLAYAKKALPFAVSTPSKATVSGTQTSGSGNVGVGVRFRSDRLGIIINFSNLQAAKSVSYVLSYDSRGTTQGAYGAITDTSAGSVQRDLIFGTCSHGVCRFDNGVSNAKFVATINLSNGRKIVKSFKLKI